MSETLASPSRPCHTEVVASKKRPRARRRASAQAARRLAADRERLAALEPGGSPERPLEVESASIVEPRAVDLGCLHCDAVPRVEAQDAVRVDDRVLRRVRLRCRACGAEREVWVRIVGRAVH